MFNSNPTAVAGLDKFQTIIGYAAWCAVAACIIAVLVCGATMTMQHYRGEPVGNGLVAVILGCLLVGGAGSIAGSVFGFNLFSSTPQAIPGLATVQTVISVVAWFAAGAAVVGIIVAGARIAAKHRTGEPLAGSGLPAVIVGCVMVGSAASIVTAVMP